MRARWKELKAGDKIKASDYFDYGGDTGRHRVSDHWLRGKRYDPYKHQRIVRRVEGQDRTGGA